MHTSIWFLPLKSKYSWGWEECHKYCRYLVMNQRTFGLMMPLDERGLPKLWQGWHECLYKTLWKSIQYSQITIYTIHTTLPWPHLSVTATGKNSITFCIDAIVQTQLQHGNVMWMLDTFKHIVVSGQRSDSMCFPSSQSTCCDTGSKKQSAWKCLQCKAAVRES